MCGYCLPENAEQPTKLKQTTLKTFLDSKLLEKTEFQITSKFIMSLTQKVTTGLNLGIMLSIGICNNFHGHFEGIYKRGSTAPKAIFLCSKSSKNMIFCMKKDFLYDL